MKREVEYRRPRKVDIVKHAPVGAAVDGPQHAKVRSREEGRGYPAAIEGERVERQVKRRRDVGPGRCGESGAEYVPSRRAIEPAKDGVDGRWIIGIEGDACDEAARQIARDVL